MADYTMNVKVLNLTKTTVEWSSFSTIIPKGMLCIETCTDGTTRQKVGDGTKTFAQLPYVTGRVMTGAVNSVYGSTAATEEQFTADPTAYWKKSGGTWVQGKEGDTYAADTWYPRTTAGSDGIDGAVPAPKDGDASKFLTGAGTWEEIPAAAIYRVKCGEKDVDGTNATDKFIFEVSTDGGTTWTTADMVDYSGTTSVQSINMNLFNVSGDEVGKIRSALLPSYVDDVLEGYFIDDDFYPQGTGDKPIVKGYYYSGAFYEDAEHTEAITGEEDVLYYDMTDEATDLWYEYDGSAFATTTAPEPAAGETGIIYVDIETNETYRWSGTDFINISNPMSAETICSVMGIPYTGVATTNGNFTGSTADAYTLVTTQPETFDPTAYYKKSGNTYVAGEVGDEWAADTWYTLTEGSAGVHGFVPAPTKAEAGKFLNANGGWATAITPTDNLTLNVVAEFPTS